MTVELFPRAETDIIRQFRYYLVEKDAPPTAVQFREAVIKSIHHLKSHPRMGSFVGGSIPGLRSWPIKDFEMIRVYYVAEQARLRVVRVLHGKRDVRLVLKDEKVSWQKG